MLNVVLFGSDHNAGAKEDVKLVGVGGEDAEISSHVGRWLTVVSPEGNSLKENKTVCK